MHTTEVTASSSSCILHFFSSQATAFSFFHRKPPAASRRAACRREPTALLRQLTPTKLALLLHQVTAALYSLTSSCSLPWMPANIAAAGEISR